jgi:hypothetical protein
VSLNPLLPSVCPSAHGWRLQQVSWLPIFSVAVYFTQMGGQQEQPQQASATVSDAYMDAAADYAMIDNAEIYAYFVEN